MANAIHRAKISYNHKTKTFKSIISPQFRKDVEGTYFKEIGISESDIKNFGYSKDLLFEDAKDLKNEKDKRFFFDVLRGDFKDAF
ncbi:MAG: hypothetical protein SPL59_04445 [Catonella sp.]|nr:hypothetical protein [Catonella sp.]